MKLIIIIAVIVFIYYLYKYYSTSTQTISSSSSSRQQQQQQQPYTETVTDSTGNTTTVTIDVAEQPPDSVGKICLRELKTGTDVTIKAGWWVDGAWSSNTPVELRCSTDKKCEGGGTHNVSLPDKIKKVEYTTTGDQGTIGEIQFTYMNGTISNKYGLSKSIGTVQRKTLESDSGIKHVWNDPVLIGKLLSINY